MQFTPEQQAEIDRQKGANPGSRHVKFMPTPEQIAELRDAAAVADATQTELTEHYRKVVAASEEEGFSGWLRRGIRNAHRPIRKIAEEAHIDLDLLSAFRTGDATLPSDAVDRIVAVLGLTLVEEQV